MSEPGKMLSYATPSPLLAVGELFREGEVMVVRDGLTLPPRCVLCGTDAPAKALKLTFSWDSSFTRTTHSTLELAQSGSISAFLCARHRRQWTAGRTVGMAGMLASGLVMLAGLATAIISENMDIPLYTTDGIIALIAGFALMITSLFIFTLRTRTVSCVKIDRGYLYLEGVGSKFLEGLPVVPDAARELPIKL